MCFQPSVARAAVGYSSTGKLRISQTCFINMSTLSHGKGVMPAVFDFSVQGDIGRIRTETGSYSSATEENGISLGKIEDSRNLVY